MYSTGQKKLNRNNDVYAGKNDRNSFNKGEESFTFNGPPKDLAAPVSRLRRCVVAAARAPAATMSDRQLK
jgi:hypothetical protein